jgi:hypothetical protein
MPYHVAESANFTVTTAHDQAVFDITTGSSALAVTLPAASAVPNGFTVSFMKVDSGTGSFAVNSDLIGTQYSGVVVSSNGTAWTNKPFFEQVDASGNISFAGSGNITFAPGASGFTYINTPLFVSPATTTGTVSVTLANTANGASDTFSFGKGTTISAQPYSADSGFALNALNTDGTWGEVAISSSSGGTVNQPFQTEGATGSLITRSGSTWTWTWDPTVNKNNASITLQNGVNSLNITGGADGNSGELRVRQPASGSAGTLTFSPAANFRTASGQNSVINLSSANNARDSLDFSLSGLAFEVVTRGLNFTATSPLTYNTQVDVLGTLTGTAGVHNGGSAANRTYIASPFVAGSSYTGGRIDIVITKVGTPTYNLQVGVWNDNGSGLPGSAISQNSLNSAVAWSSTINCAGFTSGATVSFTGFTYAVTSGTKYHIVLNSVSAPNNGTDYVTVATRQNTTNYAGMTISASTTGTGFTAGTSSTQWTGASTYKSP